MIHPNAEKGSFVVTFPDFEWGVTQGETEAEAPRCPTRWSAFLNCPDRASSGEKSIERSRYRPWLMRRSSSIRRCGFKKPNWRGAWEFRGNRLSGCLIYAIPPGWRVL